MFCSITACPANYEEMIVSNFLLAKNSSQRIPDEKFRTSLSNPESVLSATREKNHFNALNNFFLSSQLQIFIFSIVVDIILPASKSPKQLLVLWCLINWRFAD